MSNKEQLILDIQNLLNTHEKVTTTAINPHLLEFMNEDTLKSIIGSLLDQKEASKEDDIVWLSQFKKDDS